MWHIAGSRVRSIFYLGVHPARDDQVCAGLLRLQSCRRPAPPGEFPGDRYVGDAGVLASLVEWSPTAGAGAGSQRVRVPSPPVLQPATVLASSLAQTDRYRDIVARVRCLQRFDELMDGALTTRPELHSGSRCLFADHQDGAPEVGDVDRAGAGIDRDPDGGGEAEADGGGHGVGGGADHR